MCRCLASCAGFPGATELGGDLPCVDVEYHDDDEIPHHHHHGQ